MIPSINRMSNNIYESYKNLVLSQKELAEREAKFSAIYDAISDAVVLVDTNKGAKSTKRNRTVWHEFVRIV